MVERISGVSSYAMQSANKPLTEEELIVEARKNGRYRVGAKETFSTIAKRFGVDNYKTLMKLIGRPESKTTLSKGEELTGFKTVKCKKGQGLTALAKAAGMSLDAFCKLNGIDRNYIPKENELFFRAFTVAEIEKVNPKAPASPVKTTPSKASSSSTPATVSTTDKNKKYSSDSAAAWKLEKNYNRGNKFSFYHSGEGKTITVDNAGLQKWGYIEAFRGGDYRGKNVVIERPVGNINSNGKVEATAEVLQPTSSSGPLKDYVIILNPGHGGYQSEDGSFDPGTIVLGSKDAKGYYHPIEEWQICEDITNRMATQLRAKGAHVVIVQGAVQNGGMYSQKYLEGLVAGTKGPSNVKTLMQNTKKENMLFCSVHINGDAAGNGAGIYYSSVNGDSNDKKLASSMQTGIANNLAYLKPKDGEVRGKNLYVCKATGSIPGVLVEMGNITNEKVKLSLTSENDKQKYATGLVEGILGYYKQR